LGAAYNGVVAEMRLMVSRIVARVTHSGTHATEFVSGP